MLVKPTILLAAALCAFCLAISGCAVQNGGVSAEYRQVDAEEAMAMMEQEDDEVILDVRTQKEYDSGHIPGAICIPNETIGTEPPAEIPDKNQSIFVYCRSGNRSVQASEKLASMGYTNIVEFGGIGDWPGEVVQ